jgi:hypothetical protein
MIEITVVVRHINRLSTGILFLALSFCMPAKCQTNERCPWLNTATAAGALNGPVTFTVTHAGEDKQDAACEFVHQESAVVSQLRIEVQTMKDPASEFASYSAKCGQDAIPLRAIGNEAKVCSLHQQNEFSEQVVGRVRERAFLVSVTLNATAPETSELRDKLRDELREKTEKIAEQVAGFLF